MKKTIERIATVCAITIIMVIPAVMGILISMLNTPVLSIIMAIAIIGIAIYNDIVSIKEILIEERRYTKES